MISRSLVVLVAAVVLAAGVGCGGGGGGEPKQTLTVVTANMANAVDIDGLTWLDRIDRFAAAIVRTGVAPDIISMTESTGLWRCSVPPPPFRGVSDYDLVDRLISNLHRDLSVTYRVAYLVGASGAIRNGFGTPFCWYYSGDTLLYNPARVTNLTPSDVAGRPQVAHDGGLIGFQIRRSLPICTRSTNLEPLEQLIDGPDQHDRCNVATPSGPAYAQVDATAGPDGSVVASLARFSLVGVPDSSFDVVTTHPTAGEEANHEGTINSFVDALTGPAYRTTNPYYPVIVLGDFNSLVDQQWPSGTTQVFRSADDVMAVNVGLGVGLQPAHRLSLDLGLTLPTEEPCRGPHVQGWFSDHCGLLVRLKAS
jgi:hypothetical protein